MVDPRRSATRAENAQGTPTKSHISPNTPVYEDSVLLRRVAWDCPREYAGPPQRSLLHKCCIITRMAHSCGNVHLGLSSGVSGAVCRLNHVLQAMELWRRRHRKDVFDLGISGLVFGVLGFGFWVLGSGFWVWGLGLRVWGLGFTSGDTVWNLADTCCFRAPPGFELRV